MARIKQLKTAVCQNPHCNKEFTIGSGCRGVACSRECTYKVASINNRQKADKLKYIQEEEYLRDPKYCKCNCGNILPFNTYKTTKFLNRSHAAIVSNKTRSNESKVRQNISLKETLKNKFYPKTNIYFSTCLICEKLFAWSRKKKTCSIICNQKLVSRNSRLHPNCGGQKHTHRSYIQNLEGVEYMMESSYELIVANSLNKHNIKWIRPKFVWYIDEYNNKRRYYPDFYLPDYNIYLDPKNDFLIQTDTFKIQQASNLNNIKIMVLDKDHLEWFNIDKLINHAFA